MRKLTYEWLDKEHDFHCIGGLNKKSYYPAIIGIAKDESHLVYSRKKLIDCCMKSHRWTEPVAEDWLKSVEIAYLTAYYNEHNPRILVNNFIPEGDRFYMPVKVMEE